MKKNRLVHAVPALVLAGFLVTSIASANVLLNAWQVDDGSASTLAYTNILSNNLRTASTNAGFDFTVTSRFVTDYGMGNQTMIMIYGDGTTRWEILWSLTDGDLVSQLITNISPVQSQNFTVTSNGTGRSFYHTHEIIYDPITKRASYVVDGQVLTTNWAGAAAAGYNAGQVQWGAGSSAGEGAMNFHSVSFIVTNGNVAGYDAGVEPSSPPDPVTLGWRLSPSSPPSGGHTNAIAPDRGPDVVTTLADSGYGSLRQNIEDASPGATITFFTNGTITLSSGELVIATNLTITGPGPTNLVVSGNNVSRVFHINSGVTANISGLRIDKGRAPAGADGGGLYNSGTLTLSNCFITASKAGTGSKGGNGADGTIGIGNVDGGDGGDGDFGGNGGGIFDNGTLTLVGCSVTNNTGGTGGNGGNGGDAFTLSSGSGGDGGNGGNGGNGGGVSSSGNLTLIDCLLADNLSGSSGSGGSGGAGGSFPAGTPGYPGFSGPDGDGGGVYIASHTHLFTNCVFSGNSAFNGGGLATYGTIAINDSTFSGNFLSNEYNIGNGGGIDNHGTLTINNSTISGNTGGIYIPHPYGDGGGTGGGISTSGTLTINNSTLSGNSDSGSRNDGGSIYNISGTLRLNNCTLVGNSDGAIRVNGIARLVNCTVVGNAYGEDGPGSMILTNTIMINSGGNLLGSYSAFNCITTGNAILAPLGNYGGPTQTRPPLTGSPALDAGMDSVTNSLALDQRRRPRLSGAHVDIGAVESQWAGANNLLLLANPVVQVGGGLSFSFTNVPNADFTVLASPDLGLPLNQWIRLALAIENPPGHYQFTDPAGTKPPGRFYRVTSP
jgi:hypothetical protein